MADKVITLAHGNGGKFSQGLIDEIFVKTFNNQHLNELNDSAFIQMKSSNIAFTTDSYVVNPIFFPGGNIGKLAVTGTINDLAVCGAIPAYLSVGMIIEEGFKIDNLKTIVNSMYETAEQAGVKIVTGDTKVVPKGNADGIYINTSGVGYYPDGSNPGSIDNIKIGDKIIINGEFGSHGVAILTARSDFPLQTELISDCACLNSLISDVLGSIPAGIIRIMRDPTRGGIATTLNEFVLNRNYSIEINETELPIRDEVKSICEMTGFDPLYLANEGKVLIVCSADYSKEVLNAMQKHPLGRNAVAIGEVTEKSAGQLLLKTTIGGTRIIDRLIGNMLPRIC